MNTEVARKIAQAVVTLNAHGREEAHPGDSLYLSLYAMLDDTRSEEDRLGGLLVLIAEHERLGTLMVASLRGAADWADAPCNEALACYARTVQPAPTITTPEQLRASARAFNKSFDTLLDDRKRLVKLVSQLEVRENVVTSDTALHVGFRWQERVITELGEPFVLSDRSQYQPIRFDDGTYAVISVFRRSDRKTDMSILGDESAEVLAAIAGSTVIPRVALGTGSGVLRVYCEDAQGRFVAKFYGNDKAGRPPAIYR